MLKYKTTSSIFDDNESLRTAFEEFYRIVISHENGMGLLTDIQKNPIVAFIYFTDVRRGGHFSFMDINRKMIEINKVKDALIALDVNDKYIKNLNLIPDDFMFPDEWPVDDEQFEILYNQISDLLEPLNEIIYDNSAYNEFVSKTLAYVSKNYSEFFIIEQSAL